MKKLFFIALSFSFYYLNAQSFIMSKEPYWIERSDTIVVSYNNINGVESVFLYDKERKTSFVSFNGSIIDSIDVSDTKLIPYLSDNSTFYYPKYRGEKIVVSKDSVFVQKPEYEWYCDVTFMKTYCFDNDRNCVYEYNPSSGQKGNMIFQVPEKLRVKNNGEWVAKDGDINARSIVSICALPNDRCWITTVNQYDAYCYEYLVERNGEAREIKLTDVFLNDNITSFFAYDDHYLFSRFHLYDYELTPKKQTLSLDDCRLGINYSNGNVQYYYMESNIDIAPDISPKTRKIKVIVPYKFNSQLEIQMYRAYNDTLLLEADIEGLGKYELGILRNLLFAKHNYAFKSEFYQAYFNMYEFYNSQKMRTTRKSNVNNELTANDKANIALIRKMEAKLK